MKQIVLKDATSQIVYVFIRDSSATTGVGLTGLAYNTASLTASYVRPQGSRTAITLATQTVTGAYSSGGFVEVDATNMPGVYRFDVPNAVLATGVNSAIVMLRGATNMEPCVIEFQLTSVNLQDSVRGGMTALPNAAAAGSGGVPVIGTGTNNFKSDSSANVTFANTSIATVTTLTNLPAITAGWLTASGIAASALNGKGDWNVGKTGYSLTATTGLGNQTANITGSLSGSVGSVTAPVTAGTVSDKTGYSLSQTFPTNFADLAITATTGRVTVGTNADKTGYSLTTAPLDAAGTAAAVWDATMASHLTSGTTGASLNGAGAAGDPWTTALPGAYGSGTAGYILGTNLDAAITSRMATYTQPTGFLGATFPANIASTTNITGGTITTVTNLTNAPTAGDFTATMKTSIGTAVAASAVASVIGNVGGNVTGSVGSVTGLTPTTIANEVETRTIAAVTAVGTVVNPVDADVLSINGSATAAAHLATHAPTAVPVTFSAGGTTTTAVLNLVDGSAASSTNDVYNGRVLIFTGPSGLQHQATNITAYDGATKTATFPALTTGPDATATAVLV